MDKIELEILGLSSSQSQIGSFALVLGEKDGHRRLPIIIGGFEAQAIALEIENIKPNRPMTHDLMLSIMQQFELELEEVLITNLKEGVFFSRLIVDQDGRTEEVDARPSDAIALAVRYSASIFTTEQILEEAGIVVQDEDDATDAPQGDAAETASTEAGESAEQEAEAVQESGEELSELRKAKLVKRLTSQMEEAIAQEDYEKAARLRDQITKLEDGGSAN